MEGHDDIKCFIYLYHIPCIPYSIYVYHIIVRLSSSTQSDQSRSRRMWEAIMTFNGFSTTLCGPVANLWKAGHSSA